MAVFEFRREKLDAGEGPLREIPVEQIVPNPFQPRLCFDEESIAELAASIAQLGLLQPLIVRRVGERTYELVAGERRLRAVKRLGMARVCCLVRESLYDERSALMALVENLQRENLHFMEEARSYSLLLKSFSLSQEELAKKLGKSQSAVANKLRLLKLPAAVQEALMEGELSERHGRALLRLEEEGAQLLMIKRIRERRLSVSETEKQIENLLKGEGKKPSGDPKMLRLIKDYRLFMNSVNRAAEELRLAGFRVELQQRDLQEGVEIGIRVERP